MYVDVRLKRILTDVDLTTRNYFHDDRRVKSVLSYVFKALHNVKIKAPVVVLLAGSPNSTNRFIAHFERIFSTHYENSMPFDFSIPADSPPTHRELEQRMFGFLDNSQNRVVVLRQVDNMAATSPLLLHAIADPDTSPYKYSVILASLTTPTSSRPSESGDKNILDAGKECEEKVKE